MKEHQAREYIFEQKVMELLESSGYVKMTGTEIAGRSGRHGINAYGTFTFPTAFVYPIRFIGQYKFYAKNKVELSHIRDFTGIMKDITESNYGTTGGNKNTPDRYTYAGCYFSATEFTRDAQEYAWAHDIFMVSFEKISVLKPQLEHIQKFVAGLNENTINTIEREELLHGYELHCSKDDELPNGADAVIGIINGVYPVMIFGQKEWFYEAISKDLAEYGDKLEVNQAYRDVNQFETYIELDFKGIKAEFSVPNVVMEKLAYRQDNPTEGECILKIEVAFVDDAGRKSFIEIDVNIPGYSKSEYQYEQMSLM